MWLNFKEDYWSREGGSLRRDLSFFVFEVFIRLCRMKELNIVEKEHD